jgi:hypothetical protein
MEPKVTQKSAIYFTRYKGSKLRAAFFRQLRAAPSIETRDVQQQTFGDGYIVPRLHQDNGR